MRASNHTGARGVCEIFRKHSFAQIALPSAAQDCHLRSECASTSSASSQKVYWPAVPDNTKTGRAFTPAAERLTDTTSICNPTLPKNLSGQGVPKTLINMECTTRFL